MPKNEVMTCIKNGPRTRFPDQGFTLVEVVVVIAVVSLLSAIIVPMVAKQIDDAKIGRAKNECVVIAAAIQQFYKDMGCWPASDGVTYLGSVYTLVSGTAKDADIAGTATQYGFAADGNDNWYDGGGAATRVDVFDNHLNVNNPSGVAGFYRTSGEFRWRGPYLPPIGMDPWGHAYMCNIRAATSATDGLCVVMSAGPNGAIDTAYTAGTTYGIASTTAAPTSDDIWAVVTVKP